jgi:methanethiol S-methyltransferase
MIKSVIKIAAATILFAGIHSLLATRAAKRKATDVLGEQKRNALYRSFYNAQAVFTFAALIFYGIGLQDRELYRIRRPLTWVTYSVQVFFLLYLFNGVKQIGILQFSGIANLVKLIKGQTDIPKEPEGQGPSLGTNGVIKATGPFRLSRHPLNFGMLPILWLMPKMTVNLATFNLITTFYLIIGSHHEEKRLNESYGKAYFNYQNSSVNFFVPSIKFMQSELIKRIETKTNKD